MGHVKVEAKSLKGQRKNNEQTRVICITGVLRREKGDNYLGKYFEFLWVKESTV